MKRILLLVIGAAVGNGAPSAQSVPEICYHANAALISLPSSGEVAGVATNSRGHLFVYARTGHAVATLGDERTFYHGGSRLFEFDHTGTFVKEIGQGYVAGFAQQVRVDAHDNLWVVDAGSNQVVKFDPDGRFQLALGRQRADAGGKGDLLDRPSDVTWDRGGSIYVADGFGSNNRIAKFDKAGNFIKSWGRTGSAPGQFNGLRGIVTDVAGNIYVADAGNKRIQVFDGEGTFKSQITNIGSPQAICISGGATQFLYVSHSNDPESEHAGEIYKVQLSGQVVGRFGRAGTLPKEFGMVNAIDCRTETDLWVGEVWNWRAQRVTLKC